MNETPTPKQLLRSPDNRVIGGVAGGLARYFEIDPVIFRIGFGALAFVGGLGLVAYLAAWFFVPEDDGTGQPKPVEWKPGRIAAVGAFGLIALIILSSGPLGFFWGDGGWFFGPVLIVALIVLAVAGLRARERTPMTPRRLIGLIALGIVGLITLCSLAAGSAWAAAEGYGEAVAAAVILLGGAMVVMSFRGRAPEARAGGAVWLVAPALALAIPAGAVAAADFELEGGYGERYWHPATVAEIPDGGYQHAIGEAVVDLRGLDWRRGQTLDLEADLGIGELRVIAPEDVCVELDAHADAGAVWFRGDESGGVDYGRDEHPAPSSAPRLRLDADVAAGEIVVADHDVAGEPHHWHDLDDEERVAALERAQEACEDR